MKLKPAGKAVVVITILCVVGALVWTLGLKDMVQSTAAPQAAVAGGGPSAPRPAAGGALGTPGNPLKVSIVSFHGYAPALVANGNGLTTQPGSAFARAGLSVEFLLQDDIPTMATNFGSGTAHCSWRTVDFFAQEHPGLRGAGFDGKMVMVVDNTRGGDAIIATPGIERVEDLEGKKVALLEYTPSHWLLVNALDNSSLSARRRQTVQMVFINAEEGTPGVRAAYESGAVDAAVLWEPDLALAMRSAQRPGKVIYSTAIATNLIYDGMVCDQRVLDGSPDVIRKFVAGWMEGVSLAEADRGRATDALVATEPMFTELQSRYGRDFIGGLYGGIEWTGLDDNIRILGLSGGPNHFARVYKQADQVWRAAGALADPNAAVIDPSQAFDLRFIKELADADAAARAASQKKEFEFDEAQRAQATKKAATLTKPVSVNFGTGSPELSKRAMQIIDSEMVPVLDAMGSAYFSVEGNTDATGNRGANVKLSEARAQAVVDYLVSQWEFDRARFVVRGNGPDKPACDERAPASEGLDLEACRAANRRTDVAVYSRGP